MDSGCSWSAVCERPWNCTRRSSPRECFVHFRVASYFKAILLLACPIATNILKTKPSPDFSTEHTTSLTAPFLLPLLFLFILLLIRLFTRLCDILCIFKLGSMCSCVFNSCYYDYGSYYYHCSCCRHCPCCCNYEASTKLKEEKKNQEKLRRFKHYCASFSFHCFSTSSII